MNEMNEMNKMNDIEKAVQYFNAGFSCSQAMLLTYGTRFGLDEHTAIRLGTGFSGGMARNAEVCGAITGAIAVLGLKYGMTKLGEDSKKANTFEVVNNFIGNFRKKHESILCRDLLGCDIGTEEGRKLAVDENRFKTLCPEFVRAAAEALEIVL
jgi:C_GCAxxG_C_C family probable redox protein